MSRCGVEAQGAYNDFDDFKNKSLGFFATVADVGGSVLRVSLFS